MYKLSIKSALAFVRRVLDELDSSESLGLISSCDSLDLRSLVEGFIIEAVIRTHAVAPSTLIDGVIGRNDVDYRSEQKGNVVSIEMLKPTLRIASIQMSDTDKVVTELIAEDSPIGRMQLNPHVNGRYDDPVAVIQKRWKGEHLPQIKYYSIKDADVMPDITLEYIPYPEIREQVISIAPRLELATLNLLASMVLEALSQHDKAEIYKQKSQEHLA